MSAPTTWAGRRLPAIPPLHHHEDIVGFLDRLADANFTTVHELTGLSRRAVVWEDPPTPLLELVASLTGYTIDRLRQATLVGAYPGAVRSRARTGRRYVHSPARCSACGIATVGARLNIIVVCPACRGHLHDDATPPEAVFPATITGIAAEIDYYLEEAGDGYTYAQERLRRLETLMRHLEPALWTDWPAVVHGEDPTTRAIVVHQERRYLASRYCYVRAPYIIATLLHLTWGASQYPNATQRVLNRSRFSAAPIVAEPGGPGQRSGRVRPARV